MDGKPVPALLKAGIALFALAAVADLGYHLLPTSMSSSLNLLWGPNAVNAHILTVIAMGVVLVGVVQHGFRLRPRADPALLAYRVRAHTYIHRNVPPKETRDAFR